MQKEWWTKREKIKAVHENDLRDYLSSLGLLEKLELKQLHCVICDIEITLDNLSAFYPKQNEIYLLCSRPSCLEKLRLDEESKDE
ncbi:MAG: hypothetical protein V2A78_12120 [bacterium]